MSPLLDQLKQRRLALNLKQKDMMLRVGVSRQQYQRLESQGNPRLNTLELIAQGLKSELMLIPTEKLLRVKQLLQEDDSSSPTSPSGPAIGSDENDLSINPWQGMLDNTE